MTTPVPAYAAWYLVAFVSELTSDVSPVQLGDHRLVAVRQGETWRVFDATCPHRGAHLGYGATLDRDCLLCPFHGRRVHLGGGDSGEYRVSEHPTLLAGDALFLRLGDGPDRGFTPMVSDLLASHDVVAALTVDIRVPSEMVVENAFDAEHFAAVHAVARAPQMAPVLGPSQELVVETALAIPMMRIGPQGFVARAVPTSFVARAFSPNLVLTQSGMGDPPPFYFTGTTPTPLGCTARVAVAVPKPAGGAEHPPGYVDGLIAGSREAFVEDIPVWEHLAPDFAPRWDARDASVLAFRDFVAGFRQCC